MKSKLKYSYSQILNNKKRITGFSLTELLFVLVITGVIPAVVMPLLLHHYEVHQQQLVNNHGY